MRREGSYEKPLRRIRKKQELCSCQQSFRLTSSLPSYQHCLLFFLFGSQQPTPHPILPAIISSSVLPLPGITLLLFYQPEPWIKPSTGKNLITFQIYVWWGRQHGYSGTRVRILNCFHFCHLKLYDPKQAISNFWASISSSENEIDHQYTQDSPSSNTDSLLFLVNENIWCENSGSQQSVYMLRSESPYH